MYQNEALGTARTEGWDEGRKEGMKEGMEKGMKEGLEKGAVDKAQSIARNLKSSGMSLTDIAKFTGLTVEDVNSL